MKTKTTVKNPSLKIDKSLIPLAEYINNNNLRKIDFSNIYKKDHGVGISNDRVADLLYSESWMKIIDGKIVIYRDNYLERKCKKCGEVKENSNFLSSRAKKIVKYLRYCDSCAEKYAECARKFREKGKPYNYKIIKVDPLDKLSLPEYIKMKNCPLREENHFTKIVCEYLEVNDNLPIKKRPLKKDINWILTREEKDVKYLNDQRFSHEHY